MCIPSAHPFKWIAQDPTQGITWTNVDKNPWHHKLLSGVPDYFDRNKISSGDDLSHYSSASLY